MRTWLARLRDPLRAFGAGILEIYAFYQAAEEDYNKLEAPLVHDLDALPPQVRAARDAARQAALDRAAAALVTAAKE